MNDFIVERIIGEIVLLELPDRSHLKLDRKQFSSEVAEGDVVELLDDGSYCVNLEKTERRKEYMRQLSENLFQGN